MTDSNHYPIIIVGAGPTGLTTANLLGKSGVKTLLIERNMTTVQEPRAVSIDDEALRTMQAANLINEVIPNLALDYGSRYLSASGHCFAKITPSTREYGYPRRSAFSQPKLEATLREGLQRFPHVETLFGHVLKDFKEHKEQVHLQVEGENGKLMKITCDYLASCDGAGSTVRKNLGIEMTGSTYKEKWLIIDLEKTKDYFRETRVYCNPSLPGISLPGPNLNRRFEFRLGLDEVEEEVLDSKNIQRLLAAHGPDTDATIQRKQIYTFHARIAQSWSQGRIFLLGDAAHLSPPFAGQGMNSGLRDAFNFSWKMASVIKGEFGSSLLDSYEIERSPHAWELIKLAITLGRVMMPQSPLRAWFTQIGFRLLGLYPPARDYISQMKYKPKPRYQQGFLLPDDRAPNKTLVGRMFPQPRIEKSNQQIVLLDDVLGDICLLAFSHDATIAFQELDQPFWDEFGIQKLCVVPRSYVAIDGNIPNVRDCDGTFSEAIKDYKNHFILLRPDRYVIATLSKQQLDKEVKQVEQLFRSTWNV